MLVSANVLRPPQFQGEGHTKDVLISWCGPGRQRRGINAAPVCADASAARTSLIARPPEKKKQFPRGKRLEGAVGLARFTADMTTLEITAPDDLHLHVRDGNMLKAVLPHTTRIFRRSGVRMHRGSVGVGVCTRVHSAPSAPSPPRVRRRARFVRIFPGPAGRATRAHASACV